MEIKGIKETCIYSTDLEAAKSFYHNQLGLEIISFVPGRHIFFRVGYSVLLVFNPDDSRQKTSLPAHHGQGKLHFAFEVSSEDYLGWKEKVKRLDIAIIDEVVWQSGQESFYFNDPNGHVLEIIPEGVWDSSPS